MQQEGRSSFYHNLKYRINKDERLTNEEKEMLITELKTDADVQRVIKMKKDINNKKKRYICPVCKIDFTDKIETDNLSTKTYCSQECANIQFNINRRAKTGTVLGIKKCKRCGENFEVSSNSTVRCEPCGIIHRREKRKMYKETFQAKHMLVKPPITKRCEVCGVLLDKNIKKYCSACKPIADKVMLDRVINSTNGSTVVDNKKACKHCGIAYKDFFINEKGECPKCAKIHMTQEEKLRIKIDKEQKRIDKLTSRDFFKAVQAQIVLNDTIKKHFPEGLSKGG